MEELNSVNPALTKLLDGIIRKADRTVLAIIGIGIVAVLMAHAIPNSLPGPIQASIILFIIIMYALVSLILWAWTTPMQGDETKRDDQGG